ncbi:MAG: hypothetical protein EHM70_05265 [Chloroflexota bacterium]|nr:MAG: hypothetical protein EHM70_05265 [Chloroflexota bacterium]
MNKNTKHVVLMVLCCLIPLAGLAAIRLFNVPVNGLMYFGLMLLCPVSHLLMMKYMMGEEGHASHNHAPQVGPEAQSCHSEPATEQSKAAKQLPASK